MCKRSAKISSPVSSRTFWTGADTEQQISGVQHSTVCQRSHPCSVIWQTLDRVMCLTGIHHVPLSPLNLPTVKFLIFFLKFIIPENPWIKFFYFSSFSIVKLSLGLLTSANLESRGNSAPRALIPWVKPKLSSLLVSWGRVAEQAAVLEGWRENPELRESFLSSWALPQLLNPAQPNEPAELDCWRNKQHNSQASVPIPTVIQLL